MEEKKESWTRKTIAGSVVIITLIVGYIAIENQIEKRIGEKLKDPEVIKQIASLVRPSIIFDQKGTIVHDSGGAQFVKNIEVEMSVPKNEKREPEPIKISIFPTKHIKEPLILECLNRDMDFMCERVNTLDWECEIGSPNNLVMGLSKFHGEWKFRLEVIP